MKENFDQPKDEESKIKEAAANKITESSEDIPCIGKKEEMQEMGETEKKEFDPNEIDLTNEIFGEINPDGLYLGEVKNNLIGDIKDIENEIKDLERSSTYVPKSIISEKKQAILEKELWIAKIDNFLTDKDVESLIKLKPSEN